MLSQSLTQFGIEDRQKQAALIELLRLSGCFSKKQFHKDFAFCHFDVGTWLVHVTQREFFARQKGQERWESPPLDWLQKNKQRVNALISILDLGSEQKPTQKHYDFVAVFGSTYYDMCNRFQFVQQLINTKKVTTPTLYFLTGERYANIRADGDAAKSKITERLLMESAYEKVKAKGSFSNLPTIIIDTNREEKKRPNTKMTLYDFFDVLPEANQKRKGLFISSAPDIPAQHTSILSVLNALKRCDLIPETVGPAAKTLPAQRAIGALAGAWYEKHRLIKSEFFH